MPTGTAGGGLLNSFFGLKTAVDATTVANGEASQSLSHSQNVPMNTAVHDKTFTPEAGPIVYIEIGGFQCRVGLFNPHTRRFDVA